MGCRVSNWLLGTLNFITLVLSILILVGQIWFPHHMQSQCQSFLRVPVIAFGVVLLIVSLCGLLGACCRNVLLMWIYLFVMFVLIVLLIAFAILAFLVTNQGAGKAVSGKGFQQFRLGDFSHWLQKWINDPKNWNNIRGCLVETKVCVELAEEKGNINVDQFSALNLSPLESGCCKPPVECGFTYQSPIVWNKSNITSNNPDCAQWNNDINKLCYDCDSCKAGILADLKKDWRKFTIVNVVLIVFVIIVYSIGCCAFRNNRKDAMGPYMRPYAY